MTKTETYIKKAIKEAAKDFKQTIVSDVKIDMPINVGDAVQDIALALKAQAEANESNSEALKILCSKIGESKNTAIHFEA